MPTLIEKRIHILCGRTEDPVALHIVSQKTDMTDSQKSM
ncbi:MAG: hypothetical protein BAJATHORv1_40094 [Candidatus Thorarchaeota archaeon]|nr:MAG: hypothetical protein BAJATHORv1_40094 [Candidatus Thorarchaeota archaeon]